MDNINILGAIVAGLSAFILGGLWYSPALFGKKWMVYTNLSEEHIASSHKLKLFGVSAVWCFVGAFVFAAFLGDSDLLLATSAGFAAGLFWVTGSFGINYAFEQKPFGLLLINGGYHTLQYTLFGLIIGLANMMTV